ncbi:ABC transporter permease subunit [Turicibacter sanguinis]|nr:ABC transporter permease subunit [Turicibacter sanguinis]
MVKGLSKQKINATVRFMVLAIVGFFMMYPLLWLVGAIFKTNTEIFTSAAFWPKDIQNGWESIVNGWKTNTPFNLGYYFMNSMKYLIPRTIFTVVSSILTAYVLTRRSFKFKKFVFVMVIGTLLMPDVIFRIPLYLFWRDLNLLDTHIPLWLDSAFATNSFFVFMLIQFMRTIPNELDEAAKMDGCNSFQTLVHILIPVMKPTIVTVALLTFMWGMNDFQGPLIYISSIDKYPLSIAMRLAMDNTDSAVQYRNIFAMSLMSIIPSIILFYCAQGYFIDGIASTGSKE